MKNLLTDAVGIPHSYYPRPQMVRDSFFCLNGSWNFGVTDTYGFIPDISLPQKIVVPYPPESRLSGIGAHHKKGQVLVYRRRFTLPDDFIRDRVILHFGAVDQECTVYLNGSKVGENRGGYIPFFFDVTDYLQNDNELYLTVKDDLDKKYPYGKQTEKRGGMWYTPVSGIWQSVWMESVPTKHIEELIVTPTDFGATVEVRGCEEPTALVLENGESFCFNGRTAQVKPACIRRWSCDDPYLYRFKIIAGEDTVESYFAIRDIRISKIGEHERILLNGKPIIVNALLDQGYFPDGIFLPESAYGYLNDIRLAKSLGFNCLRKHIKIEPLIFYYLCDREGILVMQDMVNNGSYSFIRDTALPTVGIQRKSDKRTNKNPESREIFRQTMLNTARLLHNNPSVFYYTVFNEGWGQFCADECYDLLKSAAPSRIIDSTSGWFRRSRTDVDSRHIYFKRLRLKKPDGKCAAISEFGGYSYRVKGHLFGEKNYGYQSFDSREKFESALIALYENEVAPLVNKGVSVFVYTQLSDVEDETNGLVTYDRQVVKIDTDKIKKVLDNIGQSL